jgi:UDP-glucose 4-epimerase
MKTVLLTGGLGYIGSHIAASLDASWRIVIADNLTNASIEQIERLQRLCTLQFSDVHIVDCADLAAFEAVYAVVKPDAVIHLAGHKAVGESVLMPLTYYRNNLNATLNVLTLCDRYTTKTLIFSSSATVYGPQRSPMDEGMALLPTLNPYAETKAVSERIIRDYVEQHPQFQSTVLRYFNPVGAHPSGIIGERPNGIPNNLLPYVQQVASGRRPHLNVFGNDYPTSDGTPIRDYIHVMDLAEAHIVALNAAQPGHHVYNVGTGQGTSVLELVKAFERATGITIPLVVTERRPGDVVESTANVAKIGHELGWKATRSLETICRDAWTFESVNPPTTR